MGFSMVVGTKSDDVGHSIRTLVLERDDVVRFDVARAVGLKKARGQGATSNLLEARADPSGDIQDLADLRDQRDDLAKMVEQFKKENTPVGDSV